VATQLLLTSDIWTYPFDVKKLNVKRNIIYETMQNYCRVTNSNIDQILCNRRFKDGFNAIWQGFSLVLYNDEITCPERINWTLAHELGHVILNHEYDGEIEEIEAHFFAANLFMPDDIITELIKRQVHIDESSLIQIFGVSPEAAEKKMETLRRSRWKYTGPTKYTPLMLEQFESFIDEVSYSWSRRLYFLPNNIRIMT
jgi:Zn-dependent peptidase ImmA (M78 family)